MVDHETGVLLWAHPGRDMKTLEIFFDRLGAERCAQITLISADAAEWIAAVVADRCPNAELCLDPFHIIQWATKALDDHPHTAATEIAGQACAVAACSLDAEGVGLPEGLRPVMQLLVAGCGRGRREFTQAAAKGVYGDGDVGVLVGVDADDGDQRCVVQRRVGDGVLHGGRGSGSASIGRADTTAMRPEWATLL